MHILIVIFRSAYPCPLSMTFSFSVNYLAMGADPYCQSGMDLILDVLACSAH